MFYLKVNIFGEIGDHVINLEKMLASFTCLNYICYLLKSSASTGNTYYL